MTLLLFLIIVALLVIAFAEPLGERIGVVAPVILLIVGVASAYLPQVPEIEVDPEIILQLILPPLLFSTAMRMPEHDFRRNFRPIVILAVVLVAVTSVCVGALLHLLVPEIPLPYAIALGAVVSPSDAVAVGIVKRAGVNRRIVSILDGEGLINDASALVVLGTALLAAESPVSAGDVAGSFLWAVAGAVAVGFAIGQLFMFLHRYVHHATSNTVLSLAVPFAAFLPAEGIGSSGLVATVVAGLVAAHNAPRVLSPATRVTEGQTWDTVGLVLESLVFVLMGLQMPHLVDDAVASGFGLESSLTLALIVWLTVLLVRGLIVVPMLWYMRTRIPARRRRARRLEKASAALNSAPSGTWRWRHARFRVDLLQSDLSYYADQSLGLRAGGAIVWAGMRGAVTLAAAQTLPPATPARGFLILLAFFVAAASLVVQGGSLKWVVDKLNPGADVPSSVEDRKRIREALGRAAASVPVPKELEDRMVAGGLERAQISRAGTLDMMRAFRAAGPLSAHGASQLIEYARARVGAQREALLDERDAARIDASDFDRQLRMLDAQELVVDAVASENRNRQEQGS
ncbi:Sodium, potassium, lithium and rubidium/H(+) antiporter [Corynebacterium capitovis DSM 44611]|uniref:cation:proton antiporter n=1 Tax=Corynebacterium capitovis TaxID=131081 RepID=UPI00037A6BC4|nr:sodium:proton antiporter [Corynebacterium capitovis]WKD56987.1 Sodium, potassium, lithium and rubidium/H(+) antiporter [Corynebacterium capitovis DSM 44611]